MLEGQELTISGERMDRRTRGRQYRIDLGEWTQLPTKGPDLLSGRETDWGFLMPTMVAATLYDGSLGPQRERRSRRARAVRCRAVLLTQLSKPRHNDLTSTSEEVFGIWASVVQDDQIRDHAATADHKQYIIDIIYQPQTSYLQYGTVSIARQFL